MTASPALADPIDTSFLDALGGAGISDIDPSNTVALGQSVCPMLVEPGGSLASAASEVGLVEGLSPDAASLFAGIAISVYCPDMVTSIGNGDMPSLDILDELSGLGI
ncbi:MAG: DUF732 domain-containing protein [Mycobacterium sp.]